MVKIPAYVVPRVVTYNKKIAVEPFGDTSVKTSASGTGQVKVGLIENKVGLTNLRILFPSEDGRFQPGQSVLVRSNLYTQPWARERFKVDDTEFILIPESHVDAVLNPKNPADR